MLVVFSANHGRIDRPVVHITKKHKVIEHTTEVTFSLTGIGCGNLRPRELTAIATLAINSAEQQVELLSGGHCNGFGVPSEECADIEGHNDR